MSGRGKRPRQSWRTKLRNAMAKGTGCSFRDYEVEEAYAALIGAKAGDVVFGKTIGRQDGENAALHPVDSRAQGGEKDAR